MLAKSSLGNIFVGGVQQGERVLGKGDSCSAQAPGRFGCSQNGKVAVLQAG